MKKMRWKWFGAAAACLGLCAAVLTIAAVAGETVEERSGWLGVTLGAGDGDGAAVVGVMPGSPAQAAGIRKGDVIVRVDGQSIGDASALVDAMKEREPGDEVRLSLVDEDGAQRDATATLGERKRRVVIRRGDDGSDFSVEEIMEHVREGIEGLPEHLGHALNGWTEKDGEEGEPVAFLGVSLLAPSDALRMTLGGIEGVGVLVNEVVEDSAAESAGLLAGDLITRIDGEDVGSSMALTRAVRARAPGDVVRVELIRDRSTMTLDATLGETKGLRRFRIIRPGSIEGLPPGLHQEHLDERLQSALGDIELDSGAVLALPDGLRLEGLDETIREALENAHESLDGLDLDADGVFVVPGGRVIIRRDGDAGSDREQGAGGAEKNRTRGVGVPLHT